MRFIIETLLGLVGGLASWFVVGFVAAQVLTATGGDREGARGMAGFFVIGPIGGIAGFALCFWLARRYLERGTASSASHTLVAMVLSFAIILALGWALVSIVGAVMRPQTEAALEPGQKGGFEVQVRVPEKLLGGKPVSELVALDFKKYEQDGESVTPVQWTETRSSGRVTLSGRVEIEQRPREQYFVIRQGKETFDIYASIPPDMRRAGGWQDEIYLGRDPSTPMGDRVSITCRYVPTRR